MRGTDPQKEAGKGTELPLAPLLVPVVNTHLGPETVEAAFSSGRNSRAESAFSVWGCKQSARLGTPETVDAPAS